MTTTFQAIFIFAAAFALATMGPTTSAFRVGVIYNSSSPIQHRLYLAAWMAFRDTLPDGGEAEPPHIVDVATAQLLQDAGAWVAGNRTERIVSLLEPDELATFVEGYQQNLKISTESLEKLLVVLPRECVTGRHFLSVLIKCMQLDAPAVAMALVHRAAKVGVTRLLPLTTTGEGATGAADAVELYRVYKAAVFKSQAPNLKLAPLMHGLKGLQTEIKIQNKNAVATGTNITAGMGSDVLGVIILDREPEALKRTLLLIASAHVPNRLIYTFSPWGVEPLLQTTTGKGGGDTLGLADYLQELPYVNRLYTVVGARIESRGPVKMRILRELDEFIGPDPLILAALSAYEAAADITHESPALESEPERGVLYGISPKPTAAIAASSGALLQPSDFILEDMVEQTRIHANEYKVSGYQVATSSVLSHTDLATLAAVAESRINCSPQGSVLQVTTYDPFNQQPYVYRYGVGGAPIPEYIIIPNLYGYGLELECEHKEPELVTNLRIACTPTATPEGSVNCYRSNWNHRVKRSAFTSRQYVMARDDVPMGYAYAPMDMADMTTEAAPPPSTPPHTTKKPGPPPPDLRSVIKAAKPFMGGCIGASLGCAVCVLVLGRLPLGASPALCTGPCFTGVFGLCGALLGRVGSETTIICTELFKQGHLDIETFMADAEFGSHLRQEEPMMLKGYQILAAPIVRAMRSSPKFTEVVAWIAKPWAQHMRSLVGREQSKHRRLRRQEEVQPVEGGGVEPVPPEEVHQEFETEAAVEGGGDLIPEPVTLIGECLHFFGSPLCLAVGRINAFVHTVSIAGAFFTCGVISVVFVAFAVALYLHAASNSNSNGSEGGSEDSDKLNKENDWPGVM